MSIFKNSMIAAFGLALTLGTMGAASANPVHHPRRAEVVQRVEHQNHRINRELHNGKLTVKQAHKMHKAEHAVLKQEQREARAHGGHITKGEQHAMNQRLNHMSKRIGK